MSSFGSVLVDALKLRHQKTGYRSSERLAKTSAARPRKDWNLKDRTALAIHNEQRKHMASWCNTLAGGLVAVGFFGPATAFYSRSMAQFGTSGVVRDDAVLALRQVRDAVSVESVIVALLAAGPYIVGGLFVHSMGRVVLSGIRSEGDIKIDEPGSDVS